MDRIDPFEAVSELQTGHGVATETATMLIAMGMKPTFVFVERGGSASAAAAVSGSG